MLSLIHHKISNPDNLNEYIEPQIKEILEGIEMTQISEFINDKKAKFKKYVDLPSNEVNNGDSSIGVGIFYKIFRWFKTS